MTPKLPVDEELRRWVCFVDNGKKYKPTQRALKMTPSTFRSWLYSLRSTFEIHDVEDENPDVGFWDVLRIEREEPLPEDAAEVVPRDVVLETRRSQEVVRLKRENKDLAERVIYGEDLRAAVFGLKEEPLEPLTFQVAKQNPKGSSAETIITMLSDLQWGENISYGAMDGLNSYSPEIAAKRAERYFQGILDLATKHWSGPPPERLILILGGDMISGEIHLELIRTQTLMALPAVKQVVTHVKAGIELLLKHLKCPIDVISIPGNHGRSTLKPESKLHAETSYDNLVADFLEAELRTQRRVKFYVPQSGDALFSVYGWRVLVTHGDKIGSRGGTGFIGPVATIARGHKKLVMDYAGRGEQVDIILTGHFHTACMTEEGFGNGCLAGPSEFSRDYRFRPKPATQLFLAVHPRRGVSQFRFVNVGSPEEGSLYERPEPPLMALRPELTLQ